MNPANSHERKLNFLSGQVQALVAFATVIAKASKQSESLRIEFEQAEQRWIAEAEMLLVGDELLKGFQFVSEKIREAQT